MRAATLSCFANGVAADAPLPRGADRGVGDVASGAAPTEGGSSGDGEIDGAGEMRGECMVSMDVTLGGA